MIKSRTSPINRKSSTKMSRKSLTNLISEMVREQLGASKTVRTVGELKAALGGMDDGLELVISLMHNGASIVVRNIEIEVTGDEEQEVTIGGEPENWD